MEETLRRATHVIPEGVHPSSLLFDRFELSILDDSKTHARASFGQETVQVGTAPVNDFVLNDRTVSRFHLKIETQGHTFRLVDLDSTNGTYLGGYRIESAFLEGDAVIEVGKTRLRFVPLGDQTRITLPNRDRMGMLIGTAPKMRQLYSLVDRVAPSDIPVIVEGETGTGKELAARVIHDNSSRAEQPFEVVDCGSIPDTLIEAELFGHVKGAFTGADRDRQGIFERAHGGTVFLDEIGELKLGLQPKLLRVLETGEIRPVGSSHSQKVDVRVIAATHRHLSDLVNKNLFREDLYYRLAGCKVELPPLRERSEDIPLLIEHFLQSIRLAGSRQAPKALDPETLEAFIAYPWPGNVRQLRNAIERLAIMGITDLSGQHPKPGMSSGAPGVGGSGIERPLKEAKEQFEKVYLEQLIKAHQGDLQSASNAAQLHPKSLARLLRRYAIDR